jgi:rare lipoprotein A (peptidoglycan hydrolase)
MNLPTIIINFLAPITTYFIPPTLPLMLPPKEPEQQQLYQHINTNDTNSYQVLASWYGPGFDGNLTASGEVFNQYDLTVAHPSLPFDTSLKITYQGKSVIARVNDRGPYEGVPGPEYYKGNRGIDLSKGTAQAIDFDGVDHVTVTVTKLN